MKKKRLMIRTLDKKVKYQDQDRDDLDYYGIKDIENLFNDDVDDNIYYKPILIGTSFKKTIEFMKAKEIKEYLFMIIPYLKDFINI